MRSAGSWNLVDTAPRETALQLRTGSDQRPVDFPCRLTANGWVNAATDAALAVEPTHWREWPRRQGSAPALHRVNAMLIGRELSALHTASMDPEMPEHLSSLLERLVEREGSEPNDGAGDAVEGAVRISGDVASKES